ncbi:MAG: carboxypeptidase family protein, partial [bacterium]|nr:carboxypeptidase family protein [bacterium]
MTGLMTTAAVLLCANAGAERLTVDDFTFEGPLGSQGTTISEVGENHFEVALGHAPTHPDWNNKLQFTILRHAKGNQLTLDVVFKTGTGSHYALNESSHSFSYDVVNWHPIHWENGKAESWERDRLVFPVFEEDTVYVGHQVPMSYEDVVRLVEGWRENPFVKVHVLGQSLEGRDIYRLEVTDPDSPHPRSKRWVHYAANQHPGEHSSQWRMVGMIDWLLTDEGRDCLQRSVCHFIVMMSPDAPSKGWYRVNKQGYDMNRTYLAGGADKATQAHEAYIAQHDLEALMASDAPPTTAWSIHTWGGLVDPRIIPGPEMGDMVGTWTEFAATLAKNDTGGLFKAMEEWPCKEKSATQWTEGTHIQFGVTSVLCEGAGAIYTKEENVASGATLMETIAEHYKGI